MGVSLDWKSPPFFEKTFEQTADAFGCNMVGLPVQNPIGDFLQTAKHSLKALQSHNLSKKLVFE
jgi:hypothetical protein